MNAALCAIFFISGAAALLFETLWFRQTGLLLGNSVWTSALITASFMAGLAVGNGVTSQLGWRLRRPLRVYALLELAIAGTGSVLVVGLPWLVPTLAPLLTKLGEGALLDACRLASAFVFLIVPSSAMGATLPLLARVLAAREPNFGRVLGRLYGWNTMGAVVGALAGEMFLVRALGVRGTAYAAAGFNLVAAAGALLLDRRIPDLAPTSPSRVAAPLSPRATRIVAATFLGGGLLLALEVIWFRFLLLFVVATSTMFAVMLAVVLFGIAAGSLMASVWLARREDDHGRAPVVALAGGMVVIGSYATFYRVLPALPPSNRLIGNEGEALAVSFWLMLPVCLASGALFTLLGKALHAEVGEESRAAGLLTFANTLGAMLGALLAAFVLLPIVGIDRSVVLVAAGYALVSGLAPMPPRGRRGWWARGLAWSLFAVALACFPSRLMSDRYAQRVAQEFRSEGSRLFAMKEGLTETVFLFRRESLGAPLFWRLATNGMGVSATNYLAARYMGLFVWWPVALHPGPRTALVISYGLGTTARALTDTRELTAIDVVDVSADVLRMSSLRWLEPAMDPLRDPRVSVHVEDGRFFLLQTSHRYDLITGEPPPPKSAGIVNLYSQEYFRLMWERLREGGMVTYWLPLVHFGGREPLAVVKAFCAVFADCSLWTGYGPEWMLVGTRGAHGPVSDQRFARQWSDPQVGAWLRAAGFETPADLGATFLADAESLASLAEDVPPLVDDYPYRLDPTLPPDPSSCCAALTPAGPARERFRRSAFVRSLWPRAWVEPTLAAFEARQLVDRQAWADEGVLPLPNLSELEAALTGASSPAVVLWYLGSSVEEQAIAARLTPGGDAPAELFEVRGLGALARHDYRMAEVLLARAEPQAPHAPVLRQLRILALGLAGDQNGAARLLAEAEPLIVRSTDKEGWSWLARRFRLTLPPPEGADSASDGAAPSTGPRGGPAS